MPVRPPVVASPSRSCIALLLAIALRAFALGAQERGATGPAMPDGRRSLHVDAAFGNQRLRMNECVGCPEGRDYLTSQLALSAPVTRRVLVGVNRVASLCILCGLAEGPAVGIRGVRGFVRWWPRQLGPVFVQAIAGPTRYRYREWRTPSFQDGRLVSLRGTEFGAGIGGSVPLVGTTLWMTPFVDAWRVPGAHGTRRTQARNDVRLDTTIRGWQAGLALTLRMP